jgi:hypothetical protein
MSYKRVRVIVYTHETKEQLERQRANDTVRKQQFGYVKIESWELNPLRITILELVRLWWREGRHQ